MTFKGEETVMDERTALASKSDLQRTQQILLHAFTSRTFTICPKHFSNSVFSAFLALLPALPLMRMPCHSSACDNPFILSLVTTLPLFYSIMEKENMESWCQPEEKLVSSEEM